MSFSFYNALRTSVPPEARSLVLKGLSDSPLSAPLIERQTLSGMYHTPPRPTFT
ncbi:Uncharacterised protein [Corynebacterium ulcerans]|uniref:Uncharacterized protein n=1 Tax=Corynebacterium ulcerans TaxID=65058 RepID=A0ABD7MSW3_CORUL|nr:Uncharacterised protein [Corynebacterium ulcerans]SQG51231.1 Uncharacterised protein [Corynebacterium ulcerans]SQH02298.1 Uncharacterised protein [Corynebacterium ulcerans]